MVTLSPSSSVAVALVTLVPSTACPSVSVATSSTVNTGSSLTGVIVGAATCSVSTPPFLSSALTVNSGNAYLLHLFSTLCGQ